MSERIVPFGEESCRSLPRHADVRPAQTARNCAFVIALDPDPDLPAGASQGAAPDGRPIVVFTSAMVARAANEHELALVLGHEMAHHIADHANREARRIDEALGRADHALTAEHRGPASASGDGDRLSLEKAGDRAFMRNFEIEADRLGAGIAATAGFDLALAVKVLDRFSERPGEWRRGNYYPKARERKAAVLSALSRRAAGTASAE